MEPRILRTYIRQLTAAGFDLSEFLQLSRVTLAEIEALVPISRERIALLIDHLAQSMPPGAALTAGQHTQAGDLGLLGYRQLFSRTFRETIEVWIEYSILACHPFATRFAVEAREWTLEYLPLLELTEPAFRFCADEAVSSVQTLLGGFFGADAPGIALHLPFENNATNRQAYIEIGFDAVRFGARSLALSGLTETLERPLIFIDKGVRDLCEHQCKRLLAEATARLSFTAHVDHLLRISEPLPRADQLAERMGISRRTLHRRLAAEHITFHDILECVRREKATTYRALGNASSKEMAWRLGYSDTSGLRRAMRKWAGKGKRWVDPELKAAEPAVHF